MKAISVRQPWAWAIAAGLKTCENRSRMQGWRSAVGQTVALHAAQRFDDGGAEFMPLVDAYRERTGLLPPLRDDHPFVYGAVLATVDVIDVHFSLGDRCCAPWGDGPYYREQWITPVHITLANACPLVHPLPWRGQLGLFEVPDGVLALAFSEKAV